MSNEVPNSFDRCSIYECLDKGLFEEVPCLVPDVASLERQKVQKAFTQHIELVRASCTTFFHLVFCELISSFR